jgi:hypothetical protein
MVFFFDLVLGPVYRPSPVIQPAHQGGRWEESPEGTTFGPPDGKRAGEGDRLGRQCTGAKKT